MATLTVTHTRTHVHIEFANPFLVCDRCGVSVPAFHDRERCGCDDPAWNIPCGHIGVHSVCPSWGPVDGCLCLEILGHVPHGTTTA
jgi:hypothetical protein